MTLLLLSLLAAQPPEAPKGAQPGQEVPGTFPCYAVTGDRAKHIHCFVLQFDARPVVMVVAKAPPEERTAPLAVLLQKLEAACAKPRGDRKLAAFAVFLTLKDTFLKDDTRDTQVGKVEGLAKDLQLKEVQMGIEQPSAEQVTRFGISADDFVTVIVYDRHKVQGRFAFTDKKPLTDADINAIMDLVEKTAPAKK